jgi:hypothetical protein
MKARRQLPSPLVISLPRRLPWRDRTTEQRLRMILQAGIQLGLLVVALYDLRKRPADQVRGSKRIWAMVCGVNYLGLGPIAYFVFGRRRTPR